VLLWVTYIISKIVLGELCEVIVNRKNCVPGVGLGNLAPVPVARLTVVAVFEMADPREL
jgi:hypothetical protein